MVHLPSMLLSLTLISSADWCKLHLGRGNNGFIIIIDIVVVIIIVIIINIIIIIRALRTPWVSGPQSGAVLLRLCRSSSHKQRLPFDIMIHPFSQIPGLFDLIFLIIILILLNILWRHHLYLLSSSVTNINVRNFLCCFIIYIKMHFLSFLFFEFFLFFL